MIDPTPIDIAPVLEAVELLLRASLIITISVIAAGMLAYVLCSLFVNKDEQ